MVRSIDILGSPHVYELTTPTDSSITLIFIHGWLLSRAYWQPVIERLSVDYQCLSYDLRGFGESQASAIAEKENSLVLQSSVVEKATVGAAHSSSPTPFNFEDRDPHPPNNLPARANYTLAAYAQDLQHLLQQLQDLQQLQSTKTWLIGHSLGGSIALWAAYQFPDLIEGIICINSGGGIYLKEEFERFRTAGQQLVKYRPSWLSYIPLLDLALTRINVAQPIARLWGRQRLLDLLSAHPEAALGALLESTTESEVNRLPQIVSRLRQPVHFIAGAKDMVMESKYVHHLASFHPSFECCGNNVSEIPDCGHLAMVEQPDAVVREIQAVLAKYNGE